VPPTTGRRPERIRWWDWSARLGWREGVEAPLVPWLWSCCKFSPIAGSFPFVTHARFG
jgi:hypothetical protein